MLSLTDSCYSRKHSRICKLVKPTMVLTRLQTSFSLEKHGFLRPYWTCCCPAWGENFAQENKTQQRLKHLLKLLWMRQVCNTVYCVLSPNCRFKRQLRFSASSFICADFQQDLIQLLKLFWFDFLVTSLPTSRWLNKLLLSEPWSVAHSWNSSSKMAITFNCVINSAHSFQQCL